MSIRIITETAVLILSSKNDLHDYDFDQELSTNTDNKYTQPSACTYTIYIWTVRIEPELLSSSQSDCHNGVAGRAETFIFVISLRCT